MDELPLTSRRCTIIFGCLSVELPPQCKVALDTCPMNYLATTFPSFFGRQDPRRTDMLAAIMSDRTPVCRLYIPTDSLYFAADATIHGLACLARRLNWRRIRLLWIIRKVG